MARGKKNSAASPNVSLAPVGTSGSTGRRTSKKNKQKNGEAKGTSQSLLPRAMGSVIKTVRPQFSSLPGGDARIRVSHREYITDVSVEPNWLPQTFSVNPGLAACFPWLKNIAVMYESYIFRALSFEFQPSVGTDTSGSVMLAIDYDAFDYAPPDKVAMLSQHGAVRSPCWSPCTLKCDAADLLKFGTQRYTRAGPLASNLDVKTYDVGKLCVAGLEPAGAAARIVGELYVTYTVDLMTPQNSYWPLDSPGLSARYNTVAPNVNFPLAGAVKTGNLETSVNAAGDQLIINRPGDYDLRFNLGGTGITTAYPTMVLDNNVTRTIKTNIVNAAQTGALGNMLLHVINTPARIAMSYNGLATTIAGMDTLLSPMVPY